MTIIIFYSPVTWTSQWLDIIRSTPYSYSAGYYQNLKTIRQWVLLQNGFCDTPDRHVLFNDKGLFLAYMDNENTRKETQIKLNKTREDLNNTKQVNRWIEGTQTSFGYPFALNCKQPHADIFRAFDRLSGRNSDNLLWGTWDGMSAGTERNPVPLLDVVEMVYKTRSETINQPVIAVEFRYLLAQIIIESGAQKNSLSKQDAIGMLQMKAEVLKDCQIDQKFYIHRMAQVDCAVRLFQQNRRNLKPEFMARFGNLPVKKQDTLFSMLLIQSYHSGIGRIRKLLSDPEFNKAAIHFASNHPRYSAEDIAIGLIYHNMGRIDLGFASLYYVTDVAITANSLCLQKIFKDDWYCD